MRLLKALTPDARAPDRAPSAELLLARRAYALGMAGLSTRALRQLELVAAKLKVTGEAAELAEVWGCAGLVARAACDWTAAEDALVKATEQAEHLPPEIFRGGELLALRVEALCSAGRVGDARGAVAEWKHGAAELANAVLQLAIGNLPEALQLLQLALQGSLSPFGARWARLLRAETQLDDGRPADAEEELVALVREMEQASHFDESYVHGLTLLARLRVERLWAATSKGTAAEARGALRKAQRYALSFQRESAALLASEAQLRVLESRRDAEPLLEQALALYEACGAQLDQARALARQAQFLNARVQTPTRTLLARGRTALSRAGADSRANALGRLEVSGLGQPGGSVMMGRSMLAQSIMGGSMLAAGEDIELQAVFEVNRAISSVLDLNELLQRVLDEVKKLLKAERGCVLRLQPDGSVKCVAARGLDPERVNESNDEISFSALREVQRTGEVTLADNAQLDERFRGKASVVATEVRSLMCAPLRTQKGLLGFLYLDSRIRTRVFKEAQRELLSVFATHAAVAIENATAFAEIEELTRGLEQRVEERTRELSEANRSLAETLELVRTTQLKLVEAEKEALEKEMRVARDVQRSIVPPGGEAVARPGLGLIGHLTPATQVGGDFWTYLELPGDRTVVLIADVTGHGVGPGMVTTAAKACCQTLLARDGTLELATLFTTLSDVVREAGYKKLSMSALAVLVDPGARTLTWLCAGHTPPFLIEQAQGLPSLGVLISPGPLLGGKVAGPFASKSRPYAPGDRLALYTDGLVECTNAAGEEYGQRRLRKALLGTARLPLAEQHAALLKDSGDFIGAHPRADDVTLVLMELGP